MKLLDDLSEDELDSAFSRVVDPAPRKTAALAESVAEVGERLHSLVSRSEVHRLAEDELARSRASAEPAEWFLANGGRPAGPFELDEVRERWASGQIGPDTKCWGEGLTGWTPICRVPELAEVLAPAPAAPVDLSPVPPEETFAAPRASEALKDLIEDPELVIPVPAPARLALEPASRGSPPPPPPAPQVVWRSMSHGRIALYVALSGTIGAIAGGALVGLFAVQFLRFLPRAEAPGPQAPVAPAAMAPQAPPPPVALAQPAPEPPEERKAEAHHDRPRAPAPKKEKAEPIAESDADAEIIDAPTPAPAESASSPEVADEFDQAFGQAPEEKAHPSKPSSKTIYVPPAAGKLPKAQLGQSDIMQVVVANKDQVVKCLDTARETQPGLTGNLLLRWTVMTSGEADGVEVLPGELADSELAHCVTRAVQGWKFPQHSAEQAPVTFPFVF